MTRSLAAILAVAAAGALGGCQKLALTRAGFDAVNLADSTEQVQAAMGEPLIVVGDNWIYRTAEPFQKAVLRVRDGKVIQKDWLDEGQMRTRPEPYYDRRVYCTWQEIRDRAWWD